MKNKNKQNKKVLKRVMVAMGATALLTGGIVTSTALNSYKAPQIPEANYAPMQNVENNNVASTKLSNNDIATYATSLDKSLTNVAVSDLPSFTKKSGTINTVPSSYYFGGSNSKLLYAYNDNLGSGGENGFIDYNSDSSFNVTILENLLRDAWEPNYYIQKKSPFTHKNNNYDSVNKEDITKYIWVLRADLVYDYGNGRLQKVPLIVGLQFASGSNGNVLSKYYVKIGSNSFKGEDENHPYSGLNTAYVYKLLSLSSSNDAVSYYIDENSIASYAYLSSNINEIFNYNYFTSVANARPGAFYKIEYSDHSEGTYDSYYSMMFNDYDDFETSYSNTCSLIKDIFFQNSSSLTRYPILSTSKFFARDNVKPYFNFDKFAAKFGISSSEFNGSDVDLEINSSETWSNEYIKSLVSCGDNSNDVNFTCGFYKIETDEEGDDVEKDWFNKKIVSGNYVLYFTAVDNAQNYSYQNVNLTANIDSDYPSISSGDIVVNVDNPLTLDQIKSCFKASDPTEGDLTDNIKFSNITYVLDSNGKIAVGEYSITASVSDSSGNSATVTKKIHVVDITSPIVAGTNFSTGNTTLLTDADILNHITYSDNYYSKDDVSITLSYNEYKNNYDKPGKYQVGVTAKDPSGNISTTSFTITVTDTTTPIINGIDKTIGNSNCLTELQLLALFNATDDVTSSPNITIVTDNYTENYRKPGSYTVIAKATDEAGNSSQATATITVTDTTAPTISAINATKNQSYTTKLTEAELKALFKVSDDVTASPTITIIADNYTAKYNTPGSYTVTAKATDEAGNTSQATVTIKVIDDIKPVIVLTKEIKTTTQLALTMADIAKYVKATDTIDGNITPQITDKNGYLTKTNKVGTYNFEVTATDKAGNVAKETFVIIVEDKDVPVITVSGYTITAAAGQVYKRSDIIKFLIQTGQLTEEEADTVSVESNYFDSENPEAGNYELTITRADGSIQQMSLLVTESNNDAATNEGFWGWIKNHLAIVLTALGAVVLAALGFVFLRKKRR